tara:strand:+ start:877 stop:1554 length:678 start_codon:yes stop_codon:yes gene_type:complete
MLKIAHRGCCFKYDYDRDEFSHCIKFKENSHLSYLNAIENKFDYIEADVVLTKDKKLIMYHDFNIGSNLVKNLTYGEIYDLNSTIMTFEDFLIKILPHIKVLLDIKGDSETAYSIIEILKNNSVNLDNLHFCSFNFKHIDILHNYNNKLKLGLILDGVLLDKDKKILIEKYNIKFVSIYIEYLYPEEIEFYKKMNVLVFAWTNKSHITRRIIPDSVDGIITDYYF